MEPLPLFHERLETLFDYPPSGGDARPPAEDARDARLETVADYYEARQLPGDKGRQHRSTPAYRPLEPHTCISTIASEPPPVGSCGG
jgi:hypothetical protein